jgi:hypothetical protein
MFLIFERISSFLSPPQFVSFLYHDGNIFSRPAVASTFLGSPNGIFLRQPHPLSTPLLHHQPCRKASDTRLRIELGAPMSPHFLSMTQASAPNHRLGLLLGLLCSCHQYHHNYQPRFLQVNLNHTTGATSSPPPHFHLSCSHLP